ncbi:hypothetical protein B0H10DRAFT_2242550 [Mycena sp. CBHHK59/15]|nr:hypothetical protein B0H10DRAFT_2242550 [Mycena sp. CBHHK59/15]
MGVLIVEKAADPVARKEAEDEHARGALGAEQKDADAPESTEQRPVGRPKKLDTLEKGQPTLDSARFREAGRKKAKDEQETDTESEIEEDTDYLEAWEAQPKPRTYDERREKREKAAAKHHAAEMRTKKKKLRDEFKVGTLHISEAELKRQLAAIDAQEAPSAATSAPKPAFAAAASGQRTIAGMFARQKRARAPSLDDEIEEIPSFPSSSSKRLRTELPDPLIEEPESSSDELAADEEEEPIPEQLEEQACEEHGNEVVDSIVLTDNIAEWVDTILDDAAPLDPKELSSLATASLKVARKAKDYRSEVLFASLADFYRWMPRMGRLRAALRVSRYHGRGAAFQRVVAAQARFFEANGALKPSHQAGVRNRTAFSMMKGFTWGFKDG